MAEFVVDRNIFWSGWQGHRPDNKEVPDFSAAIFLLEIYQQNHKIHITYEIEEKYRKTFKELQHLGQPTPASLNVVKLYHQLKQVGHVRTHDSSADLPPLPMQDKLIALLMRDELVIKDEDLDFARLANLIAAVLVTFDGPLMEALVQWNVQCKEPAEANQP